MKLQDYIRAEKKLKFLPPYAIAMFEHCNNLRMEELPPGARFDTKGTICYLLEGAGEIGAWDMEPECFFGINQSAQPERQIFTSHISCRLLVWDDEVLSPSCKSTCWFHEIFIALVNENALGRQYRIGE